MLQVHEEAWNAYPYCKVKYPACPPVFFQESFLLQTVVSNPGYMKDNFYITIETFHIADRGQQENVHELDKKALKERQVTFLSVLPVRNILQFFSQVVPIDIANDAVTTADYKVHLQTN